MELLALVQTRMGSTRLPGKGMLPLLGKPLLAYVIERLPVENIVVATTDLPEDQEIVRYCDSVGVKSYCGSAEDVLSRFVGAAREQEPDAVLRICGDCPLLDPRIVEQAIGLYSAGQSDYVCNFLPQTFPRGQEVELFSYTTLLRLDELCTRKEWREHVTPYIYRNPEQFRITTFQCRPLLAHYRLVVDTEEDARLVSRVLEELYPINPLFSIQDMVHLLQKHPDWVCWNAMVEQNALP